MPTSTAINTSQARAGFGALLNRVHRGETVVVSRRGWPLAAMIPFEEYERLVAQREARFALLDRLWGKMPDVPEEEVLADVAEAITAVRRRA